MIEISPSAAQEIKRLQTSRQKPESYLRLAVKVGGCSGLYYSFDLCEEKRESDRSYESQGINILVEPESDGYLQDLKLDYAEDLMGGGFRFHNPHSFNPCGCGLSFNVAS